MSIDKTEGTENYEVDAEGYRILPSSTWDGTLWSDAEWAKIGYPPMSWGCGGDQLTATHHDCTGTVYLTFERLNGRPCECQCHQEQP